MERLPNGDRKIRFYSPGERQMVIQYETGHYVPRWIDVIRSNDDRRRHLCDAFGQIYSSEKLEPRLGLFDMHKREYSDYLNLKKPAPGS